MRIVQNFAATAMSEALHMLYIDIGQNAVVDKKLNAPKVGKSDVSILEVSMYVILIYSTNSFDF